MTKLLGCFMALVLLIGFCPMSQAGCGSGAGFFSKMKFKQRGKSMQGMNCASMNCASMNMNYTQSVIVATPLPNVSVPFPNFAPMPSPQINLPFNPRTGMYRIPRSLPSPQTPNKSSVLPAPRAPSK